MCCSTNLRINPSINKESTTKCQTVEYSPFSRTSFMGTLATRRPFSRSRFVRALFLFHFFAISLKYLPFIVVKTCQLLGFEVDFINSVQFSNHTQYKCFKGQRLNSNELDELFDGLRQNELIDYTHLLTGKFRQHTYNIYLPDRSIGAFKRAIVKNEYRICWRRDILEQTG